MKIEIEYKKGEEEISESEVIIKEQFPRPGIKMKKGNKVTVEI
ncbi:MAG: hypothetical protein J6D03_10430 [Clostridia bacterium]|nr:hypothetical protein [Clostridia bacterium]